mmetsp:Transcript_71202/g.159351  ORF Transcript_71202/g.159351 Transcript_71202/m.159351 type:complete len:329 (-) Transcript_71202:78-1064(-)
MRTVGGHAAEAQPLAAAREARGRELEPGNSTPEPELEDHVSQQMICPISHRVMDFPMISPSGHSYDRESIMEWLSRRAVDPLSLTPLAAAALYPNRALQNEIAEQLEGLSAKAAQEGDVRLAEVARAKLRSVQAAKASAAGQPAYLVEAGPLDKLINDCATCATWCGILAWEQVLIFTTSFGALLCLAVDATSSFRLRLGGAVAAPVQVATSGSRPHTLLSAFIKLAVSPMLPLPKHWGSLGRLTVMALRGMLLLPVAPICMALTLGSILSLTRFAQRCSTTRAIELERASQSLWFVRTIHICNAITGISSFGLFLRLYMDWNEWRRR